MSVNRQTVLQECYCTRACGEKVFQGVVKNTAVMFVVDGNGRAVLHTEERLRRYIISLKTPFKKSNKTLKHTVGHILEIMVVI